MKTHRCNGSLEQHMSIRYTCSNPYRKPKGDYWELQRLDSDPNWDWVGLTYCCRITYCPFCGEKLEVSNNGND